MDLQYPLKFVNSNTLLLNTLKKNYWHVNCWNGGEVSKQSDWTRVDTSGVRMYPMALPLLHLQPMHHRLCNLNIISFQLHPQNLLNFEPMLRRLHPFPVLEKRIPLINWGRADCMYIYIYALISILHIHTHPLWVFSHCESQQPHLHVYMCTCMYR